MQGQGLKGLAKINIYTEQAFLALEKKQQQVRKYTRGTYEKFQYLVKSTQAYCIAFQKALLVSPEEKEKLQYIDYYCQILLGLKHMLAHQKQFSNKILNIYKNETQEFNDQYSQQENIMLQLLRKIKTYRDKEHTLLESNKRFHKLAKNMLVAIDLYKEAFTDVKVIYNRGEKLKRYKNGEYHYKEAINEYNFSCQTAKELTEERNQLKEIYQKFIKKARSNIKFSGEKVKIMSTNFVQNYCEMQSQIMLSANRTFEKLLPQGLQFSLSSIYLQQQERKYLDQSKDIEKHPFIPSVIFNWTKILETHYPHISIFLLHLEKELIQICKRRKNYGRQILQVICNFEKAHEKYYSTYKEFLNKYQKRKKKGQQFYGSKGYVYIKAISALFEICLDSSEKLSKHLTLKIKVIQNLLNQEAKILDLLFKDYRVALDKIYMKKETNKKTGFEKLFSGNKDKLKATDVEAIKSQALVKLQQIKNIFQLSYERISKNNTQLKANYDSIVQMLEKTAVEKYANIKEQIELGEELLVHYDKEKAQEIQEAVIDKTKYYEETVFGGLLAEECQKIYFEPDLNKIQEFNKLKKPVELSDEYKQAKDVQDLFKKKDSVLVEQVKDEIMTEHGQHQSTENQPTNDLASQKAQNANKYEAFLLTKIVYMPDQHYCKSYVCGLAHNIILSGRLYITNQRLFFYSKFNPKNIFFGQTTFIQIPKQDIKKIEKRMNAVIFDNSISITTVNGELFFTSFFSRNEAFDAICRAMEVTMDQIMYVEEKVQQIVQEEVVLDENDDMKESSYAERAQQIRQLAQKHQCQFREIVDAEFCFQGLNALKFFKIFELSNEISYNRSKYKSFNHYFKSAVLGHWDFEFQQWSPNIRDHLNSKNLKNTCPAVFTKKQNDTVPVLNSGIPFMPKSSKISQNITLFMHSKDKYTIYTVTKSSGVPYCDSFVMNFKRQVQTIDVDRVSLKIFYNIQFFTNPVIKGIIESKSFQQSKIQYKQNEEEMRKYLKHLNKTKTNPNKAAAEGSPETLSPQRIVQITQELNEQIQELTKTKQNLKTQLKKVQAQSTKFKYIALGSLVFNFLLLLYIVSS